MKKIVFATLIYIVFMININAESMECNYALTNGINLKVTYTETNGFKTDVEVTDTKVGAATTTDIKLVLSNFRDSNNKLKCLNKVYVEVQSTGRGQKLIVTYDKTNNLSTERALGESKVENDESPEEEQDEIIRCQFSNNTYDITVVVNKTKGTITYESADCTTTGGDLTLDDFKNGCPEKSSASVVGASDGRGGTYCTITKQIGGGTSNIEEEPNADEIEEENNSSEGEDRNNGTSPGMGFGSSGESCVSWVGATLSKVIKAIFTIIRIIGAIIAIVNGMITLVPAVISKDADALKKASSKCVKLAVVLAIIGIFPSLINFLGTIFKFDLSCLF